MIIGLGTVLGAILERSGGAEVLLGRLVKVFGEKGTPLAMGITGFVLGIPVFFDIGIFVLAPLVYVAAIRGGKSLALYALPLLAGLSVTHAFLPPHPGPVAAAGLFHVDLGWIILMGLICGIPAWFASGILWGTWIGKRVMVNVPEDRIVPEAEEAKGHEPSIGLVLLAIGLPMLLILGGTFGNIFAPAGPVRDALTFFGNPAIALTVAVLLAMWLLGIRRGMTPDELSEITGASLRPVGMILLVVGAGAFFGAVLSATGVGKAVADSLAQAGLPIILSAFVISAGMRIAQGSATVAIVTTGGILAPQPGLRLLPAAACPDRGGHFVRLHHCQPRQRRRLLDHLQVLQHVRQGHPEDLDRAGNRAVRGGLRHGGTALPVRLGFRPPKQSGRRRELPAVVRSFGVVPPGRVARGVSAAGRGGRGRAPGRRWL